MRVSNVKGIGGCLLTLLCGCSREWQVSTSQASLDKAGGNHLYVSTHEDDDLLFMAQDIQQDVLEGSPVRIVYLTAGDSAGRRLPRDRENGILAAYAKLAVGIEDFGPNTWSCGERSLLGKPLYECALMGAKPLNIAFLRIRNDSVQLPALWYGWDQVARVVLPDSAGFSGVTYTRRELIDTLKQQYVEMAATKIVGQDPNRKVYGDDHGEHIAAGRFTWAAHLEYSSPHEYQYVRAYNVKGESKNLSAVEQALSWEILLAYCRSSREYCIGNVDFAEFTWRHYAIKTIGGAREVNLAGLGDKCVEVRDGATNEGAIVQMNGCAEVPGQKWSLTQNGEIVGLGGKCLTVPASVTDGSPVQMATCVGSVQQRFNPLSNGQVLGAEGKCLEIGGAIAIDGAPVQIRECAGTGQGPAPYQVFRFRAQSAAAWTTNGQYGSEDVGTEATYARTFRLGDINGDGMADACVRRNGGAYCSINLGGSFAPYQRYTRAFADWVGWKAEQYGTTLMMGDISGDGRADLCGRSARGIICAIANANGTSFELPKLWTSAFSDRQGYASSESYYGSVRLGDVNGDGLADVCGRSPAGVVCALNLRNGSFGDAVPWVIEEYTDALGWASPECGATIMLGDVNGDGRDDVCGRCGSGVHCAVSDGTRFLKPHLWSRSPDFSDLAGWGANRGRYLSLRLGDVDGDGRADVCGRDVGGVYCALSTGHHFDAVLSMTPGDFSDVSGWGSDFLGGTLQLGDLNGDGRKDLCGRGASALVCALNP